MFLQENSISPVQYFARKYLRPLFSISHKKICFTSVQYMYKKIVSLLFITLLLYQCYQWIVIFFNLNFILLMSNVNIRQYFCTFRCLKLLGVINDFPHCSHDNGYTIVWVFRWYFRHCPQEETWTSPDHMHQNMNYHTFYKEIASLLYVHQWA